MPNPSPVEELMRLADAVADAGTQMLHAIEIARRLATLRAAIEKALADEREACAKLCDQPLSESGTAHAPPMFNNCTWMTSEPAAPMHAAAIRARAPLPEAKETK